MPREMTLTGMMLTLQQSSLYVGFGGGGGGGILLLHLTMHSNSERAFELVKKSLTEA